MPVKKLLMFFDNFLCSEGQKKNGWRNSIYSAYYRLTKLSK